MQKKDCFLYGTIFKLHGYKGNVKIIRRNNIHITHLLDYLLIEINNQLIPFSVKEIRLIKPNVLLASLEDINSEEEAKKLLKSDVYISNDLAEKHLEDKEKLILNYTIEDVRLGELGVVSSINDESPQTLIYINNKNYNFCFPMHENFIKEINHSKKKIWVMLSEELINLNN